MCESLANGRPRVSHSVLRSPRAFDTVHRDPQLVSRARSWQGMRRLSAELLAKEAARTLLVFDIEPTGRSPPPRRRALVSIARPLQPTSHPRPPILTLFASLAAQLRVVRRLRGAGTLSRATWTERAKLEGTRRWKGQEGTALDRARDAGKPL